MKKDIVFVQCFLLLMFCFNFGKMFVFYEKDEYVDKNDDFVYCIWCVCGEVF